ncbi:hypothetical protein [Chryseobacterium oncorhynchi]|uniref:Immunity protein 35 domain-containing protein n=1 Tax=Chryseobacterium oncorhynchi TaxID=741074 RepID=A0A316WLX5_9FLAO|nr:hypothetical protein [Chryseobacterium oncorhynchi]PWN61436.1 hypothetical protein C1638_018685 [Chryseobacterium oncorhynchi]
MLNKEEIKEIAKRYVKEIQEEINIELIILSEMTINKSYGSIYFWGAKDSKKHRLAGNGPFLVESKAGRVLQFGTADPTEYYITQYENGTWKPGSNDVWYPN